MARKKQPRTAFNLIGGSGGRVRMEFVEARDDGDLDDVHASGVSSIERISAGMVRISYFVERITRDGAADRRVVDCVVMDLQTWIDSVLQSSEVARIIKAAPPQVPHNGDNRRRASN